LAYSGKRIAETERDYQAGNRNTVPQLERLSIDGATTAERRRRHCGKTQDSNAGKETMA
jgi:hypothetical protein